MAEIVVGLLGPAIELGKIVVAPIKRQFNYLCCFNSNIQSLRDEAKKLEDAKQGLQMRVATAENNAEVIVPEVNTWLGNVDVIQDKMSRIEIEVPNIQHSSCLAVRSRFCLSRKARKTIEAVNQLSDSCKFDRISERAPPAAAAESIPLRRTLEFDSRKQIEDAIMTTLRDNNIHMMGICGMGGVGKTTMAKRIMNRVKEENLFDEVVMAAVSQQVDMSKIQLEIADSLGLKFEVDTLPARAHKLRARLMGTKRILVVLDDVWARIILEDLGLPCKSGFSGCTILLTSRNKDVLSAMDVQKICAIQILSEKEAWLLFEEKVGTCVVDQNLLFIAKEVVKECKGLPVALVTVGRALKDKKNKSIWEDALRQLKSSNPKYLYDYLAEVYNPIKLSYDFLVNQEAKSIFLLCCMFPEDYDIPLENLTTYGWGLGMFEEIGNLEEARNNVYTLTEMLKNCFLLLDGKNKRHVKMHDVVRDVAIFIASKKGHISLSFSSTNRWTEHYRDCTWISLLPKHGTTKLSMELICPSLRLLLFHGSPSEDFQIHDNCFEGIRELHVLSIIYGSLRSLPVLKNLQTLFLVGCRYLKTITAVAELSSLEILSCQYCALMEELEIGGLNHLRLLEISNCYSLEKVAPGVIASLVQLEELKIVNSFKRWEGKDGGKERKNTALSELESLLNLRHLEVEIYDTTLAAEDIFLSQHIVRYNIRIGYPSHWYDTRSCKLEKDMYLKLEKDITIGNWIHTLCRSVECLYLEGDGSNKLALSQNMKKLTLSDMTSTGLRFDVCPLLESLALFNLPSLEEICDGPIPHGSNSFKNLKELHLRELPALKHLWKSPNQNVSLCNLSSIDIRRCGKLRYLFSLEMAKDCIPQLESLRIWDCEMMEEVLWTEENKKDAESHITFPKLKILILNGLPRLTAFCKGIESIEFPLLEEITLLECRNLVSCTGNNQNSACGNDDDDDSLHLFCCPKVPFGSFFRGLQRISIWECNNIRTLFSFSIAGSLINLESLQVRNCSEIVNVIGDKKDAESLITFPKLETLELKNLPMLATFCNGLESIEFPLLTEMKIKDCPKLISLVNLQNSAGGCRNDDASLHLFCNQKVTFGSLKIVEISGYEHITSLFSSSVAANLVNLKELRIEDCPEMVKVIADEEKINCDKSQILPNLGMLALHNLPKLETFCEWRCALELPSLYYVSIEKCPQMKCLTMGPSLTTPKLT